MAGVFLVAFLKIQEVSEGFRGFRRWRSEEVSGKSDINFEITRYPEVIRGIIRCFKVFEVGGN